MGAEVVDEPDHNQDIAEKHAQRLMDAGLLTEQEARVYSLLDVCGMSRQYSADRLQVPKSQIDNALRSARQRLQSARQTVAVIDDPEARSEHTLRFDSIDTRNPDDSSIEPLIDALVNIVDPIQREGFPTDPADEYEKYESDIEYREAEAEYLAAIDAAVWEHIQDQSQEELRAEIQETDSWASEEAAELLNPRWRPMSEKAFVAVRNYFRTHSNPGAYMR